MRNRVAAGNVALAAMLLAGCASHPTDGAQLQAVNTPTPAQVTAAVTRAVYDNDPSSAREHFDDALKPGIQDFQIQFLSQAMHRMGTYEGIKLLRVDAAHRRYVYEALLSSGKMEVRVRTDSAGLLSAYRVVPEPVATR